MYSCMIRTYCSTSTAVHVLGERGGWRDVDRQKPPYRPRSGNIRCTPVLIFFKILIFVRFTLPRLRRTTSSACSLPYCCTAVVLLSYTHYGFAGCCVDVFFLLCAVLYYVLLLYCCCTGWLGGSVFGCARGFVRFFLFLYFFPALPAPRWHSSANHY